MKLDSIELEIRWHYDDPGENFDENYTTTTRTFNVEFDTNNATIDIVPVGGVLNVPSGTHYASFWGWTNPEKERTMKLYCTIDFKGDLKPNYEWDREAVIKSLLGEQPTPKENLD